MKVCQNPHCGEEAKRLRRGLCPACHRFWLRHRRDRRQEDRIRSRYTPPPVCSNCKGDFASGHRSLCHACRQYLYHNGRQRPSYRWRERCKVCDRPRDTAKHRFSYGRCDTCDKYFKRVGRERPEELIRKQAEHGWCDCGRAAVTRVTVPISTRSQVELALCEECARAEGVG